jgi:hypothetical protein
MHLYEIIPDPFRNIRQRIVHRVNDKYVSRVLGDRRHFTRSATTASGEADDDCYDKR